MSEQGNRPRRLRKNALVRDLVHETELNLTHLVQPYFLSSNINAQEPIQGFKDVYRWGIDKLSKKVETDVENGLKSFLLFGSAQPQEKTSDGSAAYEEKGVLPEAIRKLKERFSDRIILISDVCLCPYTSHGHCGLMKGEEVDNDPSLVALGQMALVHARAGVDIVAPSDMMDFRVGYIRNLLDEQGMESTAIMAYTAKYASSYYGPFREALGSTPKSGGSSKASDRSTYQMDFRNRTEAMRELDLDLGEGADMVMVKPALAYLDIIRAFKERSPVSVVAYSVSAEYQMVKLMAQEGLVEEKRMALENLTAIRRAGADILITYFAEFIAAQKWLEGGSK